MTKWNNIPFSESAPPEVKADEFDKQYAENHAAAQEKNDATPLFTRSPGNEEKK